MRDREQGMVHVLLATALSRKRMPNWMPKSTPIPTNSIANATEMMLSAPTISRPSAAVTTRPPSRSTNTASTSFIERSASHRISRTNTR